MKTKRILALLLCLTMAVTLFAGCSKGESSSTSNTLGAAENPEKIVYATWTINTLPSNEAIQSVEDEINKISREEIGVEIDLQIYPVAEYFNKVAMELQGGGQIDAFCAVQNFQSILSQEMCADITGLLEENCPDIMELIPEDWWACTKKDGKIYTIPVWMPSALALNVA